MNEAGPPEPVAASLPAMSTQPAGTILVTGASGYIGRRLVPELVERGCHVRAMVIDDADSYNGLWPGAEVVEADALDRDELRAALDGIDTAYYLIHPIHYRSTEYEAADVRAAANFRSEAEAAGVKRIIYLGGLADLRCPPGSALCGRQRVADELGRGGPKLTVMRAAVIIGSGSAAYEIFMSLARRLPLVPMPPWGRNLCQPISLTDTVRYLAKALETPASAGRDFEIGGPDVLSYEEMMKSLQRRVRRASRIVRVPVSSIRFYAYAVSLVTPVPYSLAKALLTGFSNKLVCRNSSIRELVPLQLMTYEESLDKAMAAEAGQKVFSRWSDAYPATDKVTTRLHELKRAVAHTAGSELVTNREPAVLFRTITRIGGERGWFSTSWMWRTRGLLDRLAKGVGTSRGRKNLSGLRMNDVIDFWRVEELEEDRRLLLRAEMKLPGMAWLEFTIEPLNGTSRLSVKAYHETSGLYGRLYWYFFLPFHHRLFRKLLEDIVKES
ncbi:MAG: SDR family oxidoreductase [Thermoleophilia bacterium]